MIASTSGKSAARNACSCGTRKRIVRDHGGPCAFVEEWKPHRVDERRIAAFAAARRRLAADDATEITPPTHVGAVGRLGGQIDEQPLDANLEACLFARFADDALLFALVFFPAAAGKHPPIASVAEDAAKKKDGVVVAKDDGLIACVSLSGQDGYPSVHRATQSMTATVSPAMNSSLLRVDPLGDRVHQRRRMARGELCR
jgi:hypothetical protein